MLPDAVPGLIGLIRISRASLEDRLANQWVRFRAELERAEAAEKKLTRLLEPVKKLIAVAKKDHLKCVGKAGQGMMGKCTVCDSIAEAEEFLGIS